MDVRDLRKAAIKYRGLITLAAGLPAAYIAARSSAPYIPPSVSIDAVMFDQFDDNLIAAVIGFAIGFLPVFLLRRFPDVAGALIVSAALYFTLLPGVGNNTPFLFGVLAFFAGIGVAMALGKWELPMPFGTAKWANFEDIKKHRLTGKGGFFLGAFMDGKNASFLRYAGDRHLLTVAPTRAGKGTSAIIPNLLTYQGSALVIDPKGENALITAARRHDLGQYIFLLDPWDLATSRLGMEAAQFNPMDWLAADDPDMAENAMLLADALVVPSDGGKGDDRFWDEEAKALLMGLILYVATQPEEQDERTLARVRDLLTYGDEELKGLFKLMEESDNPVVRSTGGRCRQKDPKTLASVLASAQSHTHFLDSPRIRESLSSSSFEFEELKTGKITIYLILPADRLHAFGRWLRLLIQQAITVNARNIMQKPERPILFMLDEMPALGHLRMVEQAYSLMAGFGMQLWGIVQDLSQLKKIYGDSWETFIGNSGVLQYFGSRDKMTAEYFSKLCGMTTIWTVSTAIAQAFGGQGGGSRTETSSPMQRTLAYPDELMRLRRHEQLVLVDNMNPLRATKVEWFRDKHMKEWGVDLEEQRTPSLTASKPAPEIIAPSAMPADRRKTPVRRPREESRPNA